MKKLSIVREVTVTLDERDTGLRNLIRQAAGAPQGADVCFNEWGATVSWTSSRRFPS